MKQVHPSYSFVASTKTITLTGLNIDQDQLLLIVNATRGVQYFNFADSSLRATVTPGTNTTVVLTDASTTGHANGDALVVYYDDQVTSQVVSGTVTANPGTGAFTVSGTVGLDNASLVALENITVTVGAAVSVSNFPSTQTIAGTVTANSILVLEQPVYEHTGTGADRCILIGTANADGGQVLHTSPDNPMPISGSISGTVTANVPALPVIDDDTADSIPSGIALGYYDNNNDKRYTVGLGRPLPVIVPPGFDVAVGSLPAISGTVTANFVTNPSYEDATGIRALLTQVGGLDSANGRTNPIRVDEDGEALWVKVTNEISGTVTANNPNGALTTRFGSVTTANTAQITSAVTNTNRKYLLAQNISAGTVTIGIGFSPTTTQGVQLPAGGGLTFDAFCPTGAVYWLGAVTGAAFTILEG